MRLAVFAACAVTAAAGSLLAVGGFLGMYVRPTSDDWCGAWKTRDLGIGGITQNYYDTQNGRISNAFVTGLVYSHGLIGQQILPLLLIVSLTFGLVLATRMLWQRLGWTAPAMVMLAAALLVEALLFYAGVVPYETLLWAPATISHTLPGVVAVWSVMLAMWAAGRGRRPQWASVGCALAIGFIIGTLSEPFTAVSGVFAGAACLLLLPRVRRSRDWYPASWCAAWCVGLVVGFVVLYLSPGARWRRAQLPPQPSLLSSGQLHAEFHDWVRVWTNVVSTWEYVGALAVGLLLGLVTSGRAPWPGGSTSAIPIRVRALVALPVPLLALASYGVTLGLRMGYGSQGWTYGRAWTNFLFPMLLILAGYGVLIGRVLPGWIRALPVGGARGRTYTGLVLGGVAAATALATTVQVVPEVHRLESRTVTRAQAWDAQNSVITHEVAKGATSVTYHPLHMQVMVASFSSRNPRIPPVLTEPFMARKYSHDWAAACVAHYYHVDRIVKPRPSTASDPHGTLQAARK